ncbi:NUDIX domain-containing protein [Streptomyces sp. NPDC056600]|uniref:NUDIX domain-containing protein n=1 Tax=Streptomyces sp. NPDC056600 TaxID=3345874 RepID=UPI003678B838
MDVRERGVVGERAVGAAVADAGRAVAEFDDARAWLAATARTPEVMQPLGAEVWVFDEGLARVLLVRHPWRGWVPPGGKVEPGETPREGAVREVFEETGLRVEPLPEPAAVAVRSYAPNHAVTLGLSYAAFADDTAPLTPEPGQPAAWRRLDEPWDSCFPDDLARIRRHAARLAADRDAHR